MKKYVLSLAIVSALLFVTTNIQAQSWADLFKKENIEKVVNAVTGNNAVAEDVFLVLAEVCATMSHKHVEFLEGAFIEELSDAFAGSVFAAGMLFFNGFFTTAQTCACTFVEQFLKFFLIGAHDFLLEFAGAYLLGSSQSSVSTAWVDFGCRKAIWRPSAP